MILQLLIICIIVAAIIYSVGLLPIDATVKTIIKVVAIVALAIYAIKALAPLAGF